MTEVTKENFYEVVLFMRKHWLKNSANYGYYEDLGGTIEDFIAVLEGENDEYKGLSLGTLLRAGITKIGTCDLEKKYLDTYGQDKYSELMEDNE